MRSGLPRARHPRPLKPGVPTRILLLIAGTFAWACLILSLAGVAVVSWLLDFALAIGGGICTAIALSGWIPPRRRRGRMQAEVHVLDAMRKHPHSDKPVAQNWQRPS